ncbi:efflux RND transporter periplasmic adaptor subunit [Enterococcus sp. BWM-S5]|uniref:Efflux RND transporter periplasmic adaptor subunit n=1 Tax=Enterococcus larvae TaxID=2794352 RepID=A0ABS4CKV7_9ENTE|nr:efflux RND transporter periplasmic adaptor subunit [Enterococcus larvae]MBP1047238.1 efflux RND transporter periplasmic adaptor subunit [Enterococcus larvae]
MKKRTWLVALTVVILFLLIGVTVYLNSGKKQVAEEKADTFLVEKSEALNFTGMVKAKKVQYINFNQQFGETIWVEKENRENVAEGELVASYYSQEVNNSLIERQKKQRDVQNEISTLKKDETGNSEKIAELSKEVEQIKQDIGTLKSYAVTKIYAEHAGIFTVDLSSNYGVGEPIGKVSSKISYVEIEVSEYDIEKLKEDMTVTLKYVNKSQDLSGKVTSVAKLAENETSKVSSYSVQIDPSEEIRNGYHVQTIVPIEEIKIPLSAVKREGQKHYVYKLVENDFVKTEIVVEAYQNYYIVQSGLNEKEEIIEDVDNYSNEEGQTE